jgi:hypothetical protein
MTRTRTIGSVVIAAAVALAGVIISISVSAQAPQTAAASAGQPGKTTWFFYKVKWGYQDEFLDLFQRNHYPVLKARMEGGHYLSVKTYTPENHGDGRADWTFAVAITFRDSAAMTGPSDEAEIIRRLYPDRARFDKEEQRRFEILDAHWDVPLNELDLDAPRK